MTSDIGIVIYTKESESKLIAKWHSRENDMSYYGTGIALGKTTDGFVGNYLVTYYLFNGNPVGEFDLKITRLEDAFQVFWEEQGAIKYFGIGIEHNNSLCVGWRRP